MGRVARHRWRSGVLLAVLLLTGSLPGTAAASTPSPSADPEAAVAIPVPVHGTVTIPILRDGRQAVLVAVVNGVRRVPGGTVLYWSVGLPEGQSADQFQPVYVSRPRVLQNRTGTIGLNNVAGTELIAAADHKVYTALVDGPQGNWLASPDTAVGGRAGRMYTLYTVFPELPAGVTSIDVSVGAVDVVHSVPVEDGVLEPARPQTGPILMGEAWPQIDLAAVASSYQPGSGIFTWETQDSTLDKSIVTREGDDVSVDLSADVLFEVDSAELGPKAAGRLQAAADKVNARASGGVVRVEGHTDSTASDAYNLDLSRRRAQAVRAALAPLITVDGVTFQVSGKGEAEPVATNATDEGRAANRRVSVVFTPKGR